MERYVDGFVIPIAKDDIEQYRLIAEKAGSIWKEHGALEYWECLADDLEVKEMVPFTKTADTREGETVVFSWIVYESRQHRDQVNALVMADPRMQEMMDMRKNPFDCRRMAYGGFKSLVRL